MTTPDSAESDAGFCPFCDVVLDLHSGPNSCDLADRKARLLVQAFGGFLS